jgi:hypothetical protein
MVKLLAASSCLVAFAALQEAQKTNSVQDALRSSELPWYDKANDAAKPVLPVEWSLWEPKGEISSPWFRVFGFVFRTILLIVFVGAVLCAIIWLIREYLPGSLAIERRPKRLAGSAARTSALPMGIPDDFADAWAEAIRLRQLGDLAGAIIALFVHELRTLDRMGWIQFAPGRTARQLVRSTKNEQARRDVEPTLRLFEASYYGHRAPSAEAFDAAWHAAEALHGRLAEGVARR